MFDMLSKLGEIKEKASQLGAKVSTQSYSSSDSYSHVTIQVNGKKDITSISLAESFSSLSKSEQESALMEACSIALAKSESFIKDELKSIMPPIPGMNLF